MKRVSILAGIILFLSLYSQAQTPVNILNIAGNAANTGNGATSTGTLRVTIANDSTGQVTLASGATVALGSGSSAIGTVKISDTGGNVFTSNSTTFAAKFAQDMNLLGTLGTAFSTAGKVDVKGADGDVFVRQTTGTNLHVVTDSTSTTAVTQATAANLNATVSQATGTNLHIVCDSGCGSGGSTISLIPATSGGLTAAHLLAVASNNATSLKASAGQVYRYCVNNNVGYPLFLKFYNKASAPAPATDTVVKVMEAQAGIPTCAWTEEGISFSTGIAYALVKGISDTDNTSVAASDGTVEIDYK